MTLTTEEVEKRIKKEYPNGLNLIYIDYRDSFNEDEKVIEELAQTGFVDSVEMNWIYDSQFEGMMDEIEKQIFNEKELEGIRKDDDLSQAVRDTFYSIDTSDPIKDLLHNTSSRYFYYDLNFKVEAGFYNNGFWDHEKEGHIEKTARSIAKKLRINYKKHKQDLDLLVGQASYGGQLVILFVSDPEDMFGEKRKYIRFKKNYSLCIMDRGQGSGDHTELKVKELVFEFKRDNLHNDKGDAGYSYSGEVCGLCKGENADFEWTDKLKKTDKLITVQTNEEAEEFRKREERFEKRYKEGKCSAGDMKYSRHRNVEYINNYPCGNKCKDCGNFWVD